MKLLAGTSGYSYKEWLGPFYPEKLPASEMLRYYAERFTTVEINNTFYRMPAESMLAQWSEQVPDHFMFTLKSPKRITHDLRLREAESNVAEFVRRAGTLGGKLGVLLFQLPPFLKKDLPRLQEFLALLPSGHARRVRVSSRLLAGRRGIRDAARPRRDPVRHRHRRGRHAVRRDLGLGLPAPATHPLRRPGVERLGGADRRSRAAADLRLFHARRRGAGNAVRATPERAVGSRASPREARPGADAPRPAIERSTRRVAELLTADASLRTSARLWPR